MSTIDVVVVGAGPAGMAAATLCARRGLATTLVDEHASVGGRIYCGITDCPPDRRERLGADYARGAMLAAAFTASGTTHLARTSVWGIFPRPDAHIDVALASGQSAELAPARALILATGAHERPFPIPGWTLPGVMNAGAAQVLLKTAGLVPRGHVVLAGCGPLIWRVAAQLLAAGVAIDALIETTPRRRLGRVLSYAPAFVTSPYFREGVELTRYVRRRTNVVEYATSVAVEGDARAERVRYVADGVERVLPVDTLLLHQGVVPDTNLAGAAGCAMRWNDAHAAFEPIVDAWGGTTVPLLFVAGDGAGIAGALAAEASGRLTALAVANALGRIDGRTRDREAAPHRRALARALRGRGFLDALYRPADAFRRPPGATVACRCEEVTAEAIIEAAAHGCPGPNQAKAFLRCGMGPCQGRMCALTVTELVAEASGRSPADVGYFRPRMPAVPIALGALAKLPTSAAALAAVVRTRGTH